MFTSGTLNLYRFRMHPAQQLCADEAETEAADGPPSAGGNLRKCDSAAHLSVSFRDKCLWCPGVMLVPPLTLHHFLLTSTGLQGLTRITINFVQYYWFLVKLKSNSLCKRSLHKADCLDSILNSLPSFKTQSISVKRDCYHLIKTRMLIGGRSPWWTYQSVSGQVVSAKESRRRFNQVCTNLSKDRNCR